MEQEAKSASSPPPKSSTEQGDGSAAAEGSKAGDGKAKPSRSVSSGRTIAVLRQKTSKQLGAQQQVSLEDIHLGPKDDSFEEIQVGQARTRVRVDSARKGRKSKIKLDPKGDDEKLNLTFRMMLGVRVAVGRQANPFSEDALTSEDYTQQDKYVFPPAGAGGRLATPSHKLNRTFKFRDYAPKVFKSLRSIFGVSEASYMNSVAGDYDYLELITNSKSGSFFFYSHDQKYIIKNMKRAEAKFFRSILPQYYEHHKNNPGSMLIRFCGMYMVKSKHKKIPFIVMTCIDGAAQAQVHTRYDLKGSTVNRTAGDGEKVLKDNNLRKSNTTFRLGSQRETFLKIVKADAEFLASVDVMDYSMFISVHDSSRPPERKLERSYTEFLTFADEALGGPGSFRPVPSKRGAAFLADDEEDASAADADQKSSSAEGIIRFRHDGGIDSQDGDDGNPHEIYWMGIIDVLQVYTKLKHAETWYKSIGRVKNELSCVDPKTYCERFVGFMEEATQ